MNSKHLPFTMSVVDCMLTVADWFEEEEQGQLHSDSILVQQFHVHRVNENSELVDHLLYLLEVQPEFRYREVDYHLDRADFKSGGEHLPAYTSFKLRATRAVRQPTVEVIFYCKGVAPEKPRFYEQAQTWKGLRQWVAALAPDDHDSFWAELVEEAGELGIDWDEQADIWPITV